MHVSAVHMHNLFTHDDTRVELPERGLLLVTGPNGAGKSSLQEGVAVACWGKTLRGTPAWRAGCESSALAEVDGLVAERTMPKGKRSPTLQWSDPRDVHNNGTYDFTTTTKAQHALEAQIGSFDVWRRSHVFSSSDAAHFTLATDGERKRLLESVLGLDRFDPALKACRADLRLAKGKCLDKNNELVKYRTQLLGHEQRVTDTEQAIAALGPEPTAQLDLVDAAELAQVEAAVRATRADIATEHASANDARTLSADAGAVQKVWHKRLLDLEHGTCPTCMQTVPGDLAERLHTESQVAVQEAQAAHAKLKHAETAQREAIAELEDDAAALQRQRVALAQKRERGTAAASQVRHWQAQAQHHTTKLGQAQRSVKALHTDIARAERELVLADRERDVFAACDAVLGLKGVRAQVLGTALGGMETVANDWLTRLYRPDLRLLLQPYSALKDGDTNDAIGLEVEGAGGGHGYRAASGGERRRIDVAMVLALAEVAGAAHGRSAGTLWFDEVFDCLDDDGTDAVADVIEHLARERCVVVVTHSVPLVQLLPGAQHLRVEAGVVARVG